MRRSLGLECPHSARSTSMRSLWFERFAPTGSHGHRQTDRSSYGVVIPTQLWIASLYHRAMEVFLHEDR